MADQENNHGPTTNIHNPTVNPIKKKRDNSERRRHSNFFITLNTNKVVQDEDDPQFKELDAKVYAGIMSIFAADRVKIYIINKKQGESPTDLSKVIDPIVVTGAREIGETQKRLHYHVLVCTQHKTLLQFNIAKAKEDLLTQLGFPVYINVKAYGAAEEDILKYIHKQIKY